MPKSIKKKSVKEKKEVPHKLFVATPMYGGQCFGYYAQGLINMTRLWQQLNKEIVFSFMFNESLITRARNALAHNFLKTDCTHLMFIDADIRFEATDIPPMIEADKDIICGIYPKKEINWYAVKSAFDRNVPMEQMKWNTGSFVVNLANNEASVTVPITHPVEIWNGGTGFMLIKRRVFEKLAKVVPSYTNDVLDLANSVAPAEEIKEFFSTSIEPESNRLLSEDYHFCKEWRKVKGKVYAAPWVRLGHIGTYAFEGQLLQSS
jgi:hypothetical protein